MSKMGKSKFEPEHRQSMTPFTDLQQRWTTLWTEILPRLASAQSTVQRNGSWPVTVGHSFARIILDNAVGVDKPWPEVVTGPASANMTQPQLQACVELAEKVVSGEADIWELDKNSLMLRDKVGKGRPHVTAVNRTKKRKRDPNSDMLSLPNGDTDQRHSKKSRKQEAAVSWSSISLADPANGIHFPEEETEMLPDIQHIIAQSSLTPFQKQALNLLTQVPRGSWTTYQAISNAMRKDKSRERTASQVSGHARAVGMAMRTNPFAPTVPCHRMLSSDGRIGGFHGNWKDEGDFYQQKMRLLIEEGVKFDDKGKAVGEPFKGFI